MVQAWQEHGFAFEWAKEAGLDVRGLRFARDVRRQLEGITGPNGSNLLGIPTAPAPLLGPLPQSPPHYACRLKHIAGLITHIPSFDWLSLAAMGIYHGYYLLHQQGSPVQK